MATEERASRVSERLEPGIAETGFVEFAVAGTAAKGEFRCAECGYGAVVQRALPPCPMCGGEVWEQSTFGRFRLAPGEPLQ
ncbi:MAG TPA: hypothetical protein VFJ77_07650 [Gaiellaceae bacterium]|nr:hypothetical protein [Gaiellaceae bacterium]